MYRTTVVQVDSQIRERQSCSPSTGRQAGHLDVTDGTVKCAHFACITRSLPPTSGWQDENSNRGRTE